MRLASTIVITIALFTASCGARTGLDTPGADDPVVEIAASPLSTCARHASGHVQCWGGQYGTHDRYELASSPGAFVPGLDDAAALAPGVVSGALCAIRTNGHVACWGDGSAGGLGDGTRSTRSHAVDVPGLQGVERLASFLRTCARLHDGTVWCWGAAFETATDFTTTFQSDEAVPFRIPDLENVMEVSVGSQGGLALLADGSVRSWAWARAPMGSPGHRTLPSVLVPELQSVTAVTGDGGNGCALLRDGTVKCRNQNSVLSCSSIALEPAPSPTFQLVAGVGHAIALRASGWGGNTCALRDDHTVVCWGSNERGELGDGTTIGRWSAAPVSGISDAVEIAVGGTHACARRSGGRISCWGDDRVGELGDAQTMFFSTPRLVNGLDSAASLVSGDTSMFAIQRDGGVQTWGVSLEGQTFDFACSTQARPQRFPLDNVRAIASTYLSACAVRTDGSIWCWGANDFGQLGNGTRIPSATPVRVAGISDAINVSMPWAGGACALRTSHDVLCWGSLAWGLSAAPAPAPGLTGIVQINGSCALRSDGTVVCWGINLGQLGPVGVGTLLTTPTPLADIHDAVEIAQSSGLETCVRHASGDVSCLGSNTRGELGNGSTLPPGTYESVPQRVVDLHDAVQLALDGNGYACARRATGHVVCWGYNAAGELGDGTVNDESTPVEVVGIDDATDIASGGDATCVLRASGAVWCWGFDGLGNAAQGSVGYRTIPVDVSGG